MRKIQSVRRWLRLTQAPHINWEMRLFFCVPRSGLTRFIVSGKLHATTLPSAICVNFETIIAVIGAVQDEKWNGKTQRNLAAKVIHAESG